MLTSTFWFTSIEEFLKLFLSYFRAESQMFKARFIGWDDVLAVDYTLSADYVAKASKQLGVTVSHL